MPRFPFPALLASLLIQASVALAGNDPPTIDLLKSCDPHIALVAAKEILDSPEALNDPFKMFSPAYVLFQNGNQDEAVFWFYAAQLRARYLAEIKGGDHSQVLSIMLITIGPPINNYAFQDTTKLGHTLDQVLAWDKHTPNPWRQKDVTGEIEIKIDKIYSGFAELKDRLTADKGDLEKKAKLAAPEIQATYQKGHALSCQTNTKPGS